MTIDEAIELLKEEYRKSISKDFVKHKVAYALYHAWRKAENKESKNYADKGDEE